MNTQTKTMKTIEVGYCAKCNADVVGSRTELHCQCPKSEVIITETMYLSPFWHMSHPAFTKA